MMKNSISYHGANTEMVLQAPVRTHYTPTPVSPVGFERFSAQTTQQVLVSRVPANHNIISTGRLREYFALIQQVHVMESQQRLNPF